MRQDKIAPEPVRLMRPGGIPYDLPPKRPLSAAAPRRAPAPAVSARVSSVRSARIISDVVSLKKPAASRPAVPAQSVSRPVPVARAAPAPQPQSPAPVTRQFTPPSAYQPKRKHAAWHALQWTAILLLAAMGGLGAQVLILGEAAVLIYGICSLVFRIRPQLTFAMVLISLTATIFFVVRGSTQPAENFATYTFLLMAVGVVTLLFEIRKNDPQKYRRIA